MTDQHGRHRGHGEEGDNAVCVSVFECLVVIVITIRIMIGAIELHFP